MDFSNKRTSGVKVCRTCQELLSNDDEEDWVYVRGTYFHKTCFICEYENCNSMLSINNVMVYTKQSSLTFLCGFHFLLVTKPKPCPQPVPFVSPNDLSRPQHNRNSTRLPNSDKNLRNGIHKRFSLIRLGRSCSNPENKVTSIKKKHYPTLPINSNINLACWDDTNIAHTYTNRLLEVERALNTNFRNDGNLDSSGSIALLDEKHLLCAKLGELQNSRKKFTQSFSSQTFFSSHEHQFKSFILPDDDNVFESTNPILQDNSLEKLQEDSKLKDSTISNLHQNIEGLEVRKVQLEAKLYEENVADELSGKYESEISQLTNQIEVLSVEETQLRLEFAQNQLEQKLIDVETQLYAKLKVDPCLQEIESKKMINEKTRIIKDIDAVITKIDNLGVISQN